jgi:hypothetical protein
MRVKKIFREILLSLHFAARRCVMMRHAKWCTVGAKMKRDYVFLRPKKGLNRDGSDKKRRDEPLTFQ